MSEKLEMSRGLLDDYRRTAARAELKGVIDYLLASEVIRLNSEETGYVGVDVHTGEGKDLPELTDIRPLPDSPSSIEVSGLLEDLMDEIAKVHRKHNYEDASLVIAAQKLAESLEKLFGKSRPLVLPPTKEESCGCYKCDEDDSEKCGMCNEACLSCQDKFAEEE